MVPFDKAYNDFRLVSHSSILYHFRVI